MAASSSGVKGQRSDEDERGGPGTRTMRGVRWPAGEEARVRVGPVTVCAHDKARLGWSPGVAALLDRIDLVEKMR